MAPVSNSLYVCCLLAAACGTQVVLGDEGWKQITTCLNFCIFNRNKRNSNSTQSKVEPLPQVIWQLLQKAIQKAIKGFNCKSFAEATNTVLAILTGTLTLTGGDSLKHTASPN